MAPALSLASAGAASPWNDGARRPPAVKHAQGARPGAAPGAAPDYAAYADAEAAYAAYAAGGQPAYAQPPAAPEPGA